MLDGVADSVVVGYPILTTCASGDEVLPALVESPAYTAVSACDPTVKDEMENAPVPFANVTVES